MIPMGIEAPERARILGHSVETNLKHYMFSRDKEYYYEVADIWDKYNEECGITSKKNSNGRWGETEREKGSVNLFPVEPTDEALVPRRP